MSLQMMAVTFDCANAAVLAEFWSAAVGRPIDRDGDMAANEFFARIPGDGTQPMMMFIQVPEGKTAKNRVHLDMNTSDRTAEVERSWGWAPRTSTTKPSSASSGRPSPTPRATSSASRPTDPSAHPQAMSWAERSARRTGSKSSSSRTAK